MKKVFVTGIFLGMLFMGSAAMADFTLSQGNQSWAIDPIQGTKTATTFYSYGSPYRWSGASTEFEHLVSKIYLYQDPGTNGSLNLVMHHSARNRVDEKWIKVDFQFSGVPTGTTVPLSDDRRELTLTQGHWKFKKNSDGGIFGNLSTTEDWCITITPTFDRCIESWQYVNNISPNPIGLSKCAPIKICHTANPVVPAPGAILLGSLGTSLVGWFRRRRSL